MAELVKEMKDERLQTEAANELIKKFEPKINKICSQVPDDYREDLKQEIIVELIKAAKRFEFHEAPDFWKFNQNQLKGYFKGLSTKN